MAPWSSFSMCQKVYRILASHDRLATVRNVKQAERGERGERGRTAGAQREASQFDGSVRPPGWAPRHATEPGGAGWNMFRPVWFGFFPSLFSGFTMPKSLSLRTGRGKERTRDYTGTSTPKLSLAIPSSTSDRARLRPIRHSFKPTQQLKT